MIGLILFNIRFKKTKISNKHFEKIIKKINTSTAGYTIIALLSVLVAATVSANEVMQLGLFDSITDFIKYEKIILVVSGALFAACTYIVFFSRKIKLSAMNILTKRSAEMIQKTFEEENLTSKRAIISNLANGKELGFSSDSAICAIIPKRNELTIFEMFIDFVEIDNKLYPIFKNDKSTVIKVDNSDILSISEYFERGNFVPKPVKQAINTLMDQKKELIEYGLDLEEVIEPQENTVIELQTVSHRFAFRAYKFKEILSGVYTDIQTKNDHTAMAQENAELKSQVQRYKAKLAEVING